MTQKGLLIVSVPLLCELLFVGALVLLLNRAESEADRAEEARIRVAKANEIASLFYGCTTTLLAYRVTERDEFKEKIQLIIDQVDQLVDSLSSIRGLSPEQQKLIPEIRAATKTCSDLILSSQREAESAGSLIVALHVYDQRRQAQIAIKELSNRLNEFVKTEKKLEQKAPEAKRAGRRQLSLLLGCGLVVNILVAIGLALFFSKEIVSRLAVMVDNTERLARQQELNQLCEGADEISHLDKVFHKMADELELAARVKQEFVSMITHDLRTPLASMQADLEMVVEDDDGHIDDSVHKVIKRASRNAFRLITLINELLLLEKAEAGKVELYLEPIAVSAIVDEAVEAVRGFAARKKIRLVVSESDDVRVNADRGRLVQVLINLLSNAVKFSPQDSSINLTTSPQDQTVEFRITDQGPGIPPSEREKVFERFHQIADSQKSSSLAGTGLGLPICRSIVLEHAGTIGVDSEEGRGASFWFRIPMA